MINVNQITARLASMPDQALQQYAAMHKNDPYTMALALSESNRRKQMRQGAQMQAPQQPKVVDQELAQMAQPMPEDTGIGQLPAPNMQSMAEGGIVAFEGGGEVPGYAEGLFNAPKVPPGAIIMGNMYIDPATGERRYLPGAEPSSEPNPYRGMSLGDFAGRIKDSLVESYKNPSQFYTPADLLKMKTEKQNEAAQDQRGPLMKGYTPRRSDEQQFQADVATRSGLPDSSTTVAPPVKPPAAPQGTLGARTKTPPAPAAKPAAGLPALNTKPMSAAEAAKQAAALGDDKEVRGELQSYVDRQKKIGEEAVGSFEKGIAGLPEAYKKYEERLQKEEADAATDKDKAMGMSIFKAGLAMMAGTSQNAFENIGKGALAGLDDYQTALKDFKKAQRERDKAFADIEQARLADQRGDLKTKLELESRAADRTSNAEGKMVEGIAKLFDTNKTNARGIYQTGIEQANQNQRAMYEQGEQTKRTIIQANAPTGLERIYSNPALYKKHIEAQTAATGMRGDTAHRETWAKSPMLRAQYPKIDDYLRVMGIQPTVNLPANATNVLP